MRWRRTGSVERTASNKKLGVCKLGRSETPTRVSVFLTWAIITRTNHVHLVVTASSVAKSVRFTLLSGIAFFSFRPHRYLVGRLV